MDGGWATGGQKFKRRILDVSVYIDPFSFNSGNKLNHKCVFFKIEVNFMI